MAFALRCKQFWQVINWEFRKGLLHCIQLTREQFFNIINILWHLLKDILRGTTQNCHCWKSITDQNFVPPFCVLELLDLLGLVSGNWYWLRNRFWSLLYFEKRFFWTPWLGNRKKTLINCEDCKMVAAKFIASLC